jgi:peptide-methionine (S)-S-oxide reductase
MRNNLSQLHEIEVRWRLGAETREKSMLSDVNKRRSRPWSLLRNIAVAAVIPLLGLGLLQTASGAPEQAVVIPAPADDLAASGSTAKAVFAGGCFWGVQGVFQHLEGVKSAVSGYAGGDASTAKYELIGTGRTGHAEAVEIVYDPNVVSYGQLLHIYFSVAHNPTQLNYQGPDHGPQYRSAIFFETPEQKAMATAYIEQLDKAGVYPEPIVTTLEPLEAFYAAEDYHQDFLTVNPNHPYIVYHDLPKIESLKALFPEVYRDDPVLVSEAM